MPPATTAPLPPAHRAQLRAELACALDAGVRAGTVTALVSVELDDFRLIADALGAASGDALLALVAARLDEVVRPGDVLGHAGGAEFALVVRDLPETGARNAAEAVGQDVLDALAAPFVLGDAELLVEASVGVALHPLDASGSEHLARCADAARYEARISGARCALHRRTTADPLARLALGARLRRGIAAGELELHFQPVFRLAEGRSLGVEALVRWRHPELGLVPPADFVPVAERTGLVEVLGDWVVRETCRQLVAWRAQGLAPHAGVNVSPGQLRRPGFAARLAAVVHAHDLDPSRIVLELTESAWTLDDARLLPVLQELRAAGFALAIDDFGAGHSSLWRLRELPVQVIKVDRSFLRGVPEDPDAVAVYSAILALAEARGCDVVAEGVETEAQRAFLLERGALLAQGYGLARPAPAAAVTPVLAEALVASRRPAA